MSHQDRNEDTFVQPVNTLYLDDKLKYTREQKEMIRCTTGQQAALMFATIRRERSIVEGANEQ